MGVSNWKVRFWEGSEAASVRLGTKALADSIDGRVVARFSSRSARNAATAAYLGQSGNASQTGMQAYCDDLYTNTVHTPNGWKYVSPVYFHETTHRGYGSGWRIETPQTSEVDDSPYEWFGLPPDSIITINTLVLVEAEGSSDQTIAVTYDTIGATRLSPDPLTYRYRLLATASPDEYLPRTWIHKYQVTNENVQFNLRVHAGSAANDLIITLIQTEFTCTYGRSPAA